MVCVARDPFRWVKNLPGLCSGIGHQQSGGEPIATLQCPMSRQALRTSGLQNLGHKIRLLLNFGAGNDVRPNGIIGLARQQAGTIGEQTEVSGRAIKIL
jgi:hypothetical protein